MTPYTCYNDIKLRLNAEIAITDHFNAYRRQLRSTQRIIPHNGFSSGIYMLPGAEQRPTEDLYCSAYVSTGPKSALNRG